MTLIGLSMVIGSVLTRPFLRIVYTEKWATDSAVSIMRAYCIYTMFMALNGVVEAYAYATADSRVLKKLQNSLILISIIYVCSSCTLSSFMGI